MGYEIFQIVYYIFFVANEPVEAWRRVIDT